MGAPATPAFAVAVPIFDSWVDLSPSSWVSPSAGCGTNTPGCPTGIYTYETCWCECVSDSTGGTVEVDVAADNEAVVLINGAVAPGGAIPTPTPPGTEFKASAHVAFSYAPGLERNCLQVEVTNFDEGSATAMVLSGTVTGFRGESGGECPPLATPTSTSTLVPTPTRTNANPPD